MCFTSIMTNESAHARALIHPATWTHPKYPGDAVRIVYLTHPDDAGGETLLHGDVRIQDYGPGCYRVGAFTPGYETSSPGDTPKTNPQHHSWCETVSDANIAFRAFVKLAHAEGWNDRP